MPDDTSQLKQDVTLLKTVTKIPNPLFDIEPIFTIILALSVFFGAFPLINNFAIKIINYQDWQWWVATIAGVVGFIFLWLANLIRMPPMGIIFLVIFLAGFGLSIGFTIWVFVEDFQNISSNISESTLKEENIGESIEGATGGEVEASIIDDLINKGKEMINKFLEGFGFIKDLVDTSGSAGII
ncbi:MAG: hypothetical protein PHT91_03625 [Candidatus Nanoarchaeia archaeon]|nr:hypothetical protein [Candidatus Nanoarchaeia archaeon]